MTVPGPSEDHASRMVTPNYPADTFAGTAEVYAQCRPPYPRTLFDDLRNRAGTTGQGRLLDLAGGPGRVALPLAPHFREVWAQDLEPEMVAVGRRLAQERGLTNVTWVVGRAEEFEGPPASFEMITISEAFHRLDQRLIARRSMDWLVPGGCLVTMGVTVLKGHAPWQIAVEEVKAKWKTDAPGAKYYPEISSVQTHEEVVQAAGFVEVKSYDFPTPYVWTIDSIIGMLNSSSGYSKRVLGDKADAFATDLRHTLLAHDPSGRFEETLVFGYTLARRPKR